MRFTAVLSTSLALAAGASAMGAADMVNNINQITDISSATDDIAKSLSAVNVFQKAPQVVNNFKQIIDTVSKDITAMNAKRDLSKRQECLNVEDIEKCLGDLGEIAEDPSEILGGARKRGSAVETGPTVEDAKNIVLKRQECLNVEDIEKCLEDLGEIAEDPSEILGKRANNPVGDAVKQVEGSLPTKRGDIVSDLTQNAPGGPSVRRRQEDPVYTDLEQSQVCNAFRGFVQVHQALLNTVIGKHGLLSLTPFTQPIAAVLRTLEGGVDTIAFGIINTVPTCAEGATNDKNSLDMTLADAQDTYN